MQLKALAI